MSPLALSLRFLQTQPDGRLVELSRAGHERAFEALVQRYRRQLLAYCRRITASEASAEDALQQALLQAWVALSTSEVEVRDARAWLYRIVHNVAISNLRRTQPDAVEVDDAQRVSGADHEVERRLAVREALAGLASLPELQRQVMLSTALEGRSHDEIATALGLSHGAVRGLIYRARAALRAAAAAVTPAPLVHWAVRQQAPGAGRSAGLIETIAAGGGGVGLGGVLLKGGAVVVSVGAFATAAGITSTHSHHHARVVAPHVGSPASGASHAAAAGATTAVTVSAVRLASASAGTAHRRGRNGGLGAGPGGRSGSHSGRDGSSGHGGPSIFSGGSSHDHSGGSGQSGGDGHGSGSGHSGGGSGDSGHRSGSDGGSGGDQQSGHDGSRTGGATSGDGGSGPDHGGGGGDTLSSTTTVTSTSGGTGDGRGGGSGGDGGGDQTGGTTTGSTTTVTTTSTTTSGSATSGN